MDERRVSRNHATTRRSTMSADERDRKRKEHDEEPDVEAHSYTTDDPTEDDPERKRKRKEFEDAEDGELGRKRK
jgi:hypothetical protein